MSVGQVLLFIITPVLVFFITGVIYYFIRERQLTSLLRNCIKDSLNISILQKKFSLRQLYLFSSVVEKVASFEDVFLPEKIGINEYWIKSLIKKPTFKKLKRVLRFCNEKGIHEAFLVVLDKPKLRSVFINFIQEQKREVVFNILAKRLNLIDFNGKESLSLLIEDLEELALMCDSSAPEDRWFAFKNLAFLEDDHIFGKLKWKAIKDHSVEIRRMMIKEINTNDDEKFFNYLYEQLLNDTDQKIRVRSKEIIVEKFSNFYNPNNVEMTLSQKIHFAENFREEFEEDKKIAFEWIKSTNLELRQFSADFLNEIEALSRLILSVDINDPSRIEYSCKLLEKAIDVHSDQFLKSICISKNPGTLMVAANLLEKKGNRKNIAELARSVFELRKLRIINPLKSDIYRKTLKCIEKRGTAAAFEELKKELLENRYDDEVAKLILDNIPKDADFIFEEVFLSFIKNPKLNIRENLINAIIRISSEKINFEFFRLIKKGPELHWNVHLNIISYFKQQKVEYCFQYLLENLSFFPKDAVKEILVNLYQYSPKLFNETLSVILEKEYSNSSVPLLNFLYFLKDKRHIPQIKKATESDSSTIRLAGLRGFFKYKTEDFYSYIEPFLNDSEKEVRLLSAKLMAISASEKEIDRVREILFDENELLIVKKSLIKGLSESQNPKSELIMVEVAEKEHALFEHLLECLLEKEAKVIAKNLATVYSKTKERGQKLICKFFKYKGLEEQEILLELLKKNLAKGTVCSIQEILYKTDFIDKTIAKLRNKSVDIRNTALNNLMIIDTLPAYKGILLATRDNNREIRKIAYEKMLKIFEKDKNIFDQLTEDSSRIVQKNVKWIQNKIEKNRG